MVVKKKADISLVLRVRTAGQGEIITKNMEKQQEDNSEGDICYLENICGAGQTKRTLSKMN